MVTFIGLFFGVYYILATFLGALFLAREGVVSVLILLMLAFGALAIFGNSRRAWTPAILCLLGMVAFEVLAPYEAMLEIVGALILAGIGTYVVKRQIVAYIRRDVTRPGGPRLSQTLRTFLRYF